MHLAIMRSEVHVSELPPAGKKERETIVPHSPASMPCDCNASSDFWAVPLKVHLMPCGACASERGHIGETAAPCRQPEPDHR